MANVILLNVAAPKIRRCRRVEMVRQRQEIPFKPKKTKKQNEGAANFPRMGIPRFAIGDVSPNHDQGLFIVFFVM
jgi:hypothetical protein